MLVLIRFRVPESAAGGIAAELEDVRALLATREGYVDGAVARNTDDPGLWVLQTRWTGAGAWRRALSSYEVKAGAWATLARALDEPSAYEVVPPSD